MNKTSNEPINYTPYEEIVKKYEIIRDMSGKSGDRTFIIRKRRGKIDQLYILKILRNKCEIHVQSIINKKYEFAPKVIESGLTNSRNLITPTILIYHYFIQEFILSPDFLVTYKNKVYEDYSVKEIKSILFQLLYFFYLINLESRFYHLDLKPGNMIVDQTQKVDMIVEIKNNKYHIQSDKVYLIDFGCSVYVERIYVDEKNKNMLTFSQDIGLYDRMKAFFRHHMHVRQILSLIDNESKNISYSNINNYDLIIWHIVKQLLEYQNKNMTIDKNFICQNFEECLTSEYFDDLIESSTK